MALNVFVSKITWLFKNITDDLDAAVHVDLLRVRGQYDYHRVCPKEQFW